MKNQFVVSMSIWSAVLLTVLYTNVNTDHSTKLTENRDVNTNYIKANVIVDDEDMIRNIKALYNNTDNADDLITHLYTDSDIENMDANIFHLINSGYIECVRYISFNYFYIIQKTKTNNYNIMLYDINLSPYPIEKWNISKLYLNEFDVVEVGKTTLENVKMLDPFGVYDSIMLSSSNHFSSYHHTIDGYEICINYKVDNNYMKVSNITKFPPEENLVYKLLLPQDKKILNQVKDRT